MKKIRYAVIGLGHIAQVAVLPAFKNASRNSTLSALISGDSEKKTKLKKKYKVPHTYSYEEYEEALQSDTFDAVYVALPNDLHHSYVMKALHHGKHVLCEKPLCVSTKECDEIIDYAREKKLKVMTAYRLHFNRANLKALQLIEGGRIGTPKYFNSVFSFQITDPSNIRLSKAHGGGALRDIGIYCINAARTLFKEDPISVMANFSSTDSRFAEVEEAASVSIVFPDGKLANFVCSFGAADKSKYEVVGTEGSLILENAYDYAQKMKLSLAEEKKSQKFNFPKEDQFGAEIDYFSNCIVHNFDPEPSAQEGPIDVAIIEAIENSAMSGQRITLPPFKEDVWPTPRQAISKPAISKPDEIKVASPHS